ncbi:hypothetical protein AGABI1DRAFT_129315 [Agaricus bisporus var. burnettii JB137-S8]|uniref:Uncharacterized protein n=1 Tax=Agaricus bisporus var. burnettii (strain JB137-S8 / ATCC MYA-4627 / FGSC 10392) TaxID=597362 RepID=K5WS25_AGABU|nr:uncharacterized protein AGABI1DRAFT_129315 [Agaricus bisporus var. burnettii JB137-S8]EKM78186.1 hypothetical protein AGABI1DRAFT_129315 [Agaricus bisporus var. burnettii JB137-S8]
MALSNTQRAEPEVDMVPLARMTRTAVERLAPFCQMRLLPENPTVPLAQKINGKILGLLHAVDTTMLIAQIGYKMSNDAATLCDPFAPVIGSTCPSGISTPETLQTMAAHGHGHCQRANECLRSIQQEIFKIAAATKDNETFVLVPPDSQQPATRRIALKEVGTDLVANLNLLNRFSRSLLDLMSWWEWLEEELLSPNSTLLPSMKDRDADLYARWSRIKAGYLDYYNTIRVVYTRYPQLLTTSSSAWQSISSVPPPPSSPGSSWDGSYEDLGAAFDEATANEVKTISHDKLPDAEKAKGAKGIRGIEQVKALVVKLKLSRSLKSEKETTGDKGKRKAVDDDPINRGPEVTPPDPHEQMEVERLPVETVPSQTSQHNPPVSTPESQITREVKPPQGDKEYQTTRSAAPSSNAEPNGGEAKILDSLKRILAALACHKGGEITS